MSGIFGFINLDNRQASPAYLKCMARKASRWGPDGIHTVCSAGGAFGHALLAVTREARQEAMPVWNADAGILFTTAARLDNREELYRLLGMGLSEQIAAPDGQLVFQAYLKWGPDACRYFLGDWSFAAWHSKTRRLFLARDHLGNTGLFYYFKPPVAVFGSSVEFIFPHPEMPRELDEISLAHVLGAPATERDETRTLWKDVFHLPPATAVTISEAGKTAAGYWRLDQVPALRLKSDEAYVEGFLDLYRQAVKTRLNSVRPIASTLSAGLDSSSVTVLAAQTLKGTGRILAAYTAMPVHPVEVFSPRAITDEWPLAHAAAARHDHIVHIPVQATDISPLAGVRRCLAITSGPQHAAANMFWLVSLFKDAEQRNIGVLLTGQMGNGGVSWSGGRDRIFYLFAQNRWTKGVKELAEWKKQHGVSWLSAVKHHLLRPLAAPCLSGLINPRTGINPQGSLQGLISAEFARHLGLDQPSASRHAGYTPQHRISPVHERMRTLMNNGGMVGPIWHSLGAFYHMEARDPTADIRLLEFCLGIPDEQHAFQGGERMLIRRAMAGILPDPLRLNRLRGKQAADIVCRLLDQRTEINSELARLRSIPLINHYMDMKRITTAWKDIQGRKAQNHGNLAKAFLRAVSIAYFLAGWDGNRS